MSGALQAAGLTATPNSVVLSADMFTCVDAVDESGKQLAEVEWSLSAPIAKLTKEQGRACLQGGEHAGRAILTATVGGVSATTVVTVLAGRKLPPYTVRWSLDPTPGYETLEARQAEPVGDVDLYSIEWSESAGTVVKALRFTGEQLWSTHLQLKASPATLKQRTFSIDGITYQGSKRLNNVGQMILGEGNVVYTVTPNNPREDKRVPEGQEILVRDSGDGFGGLLLFERGHISDSIVDVSPEDGHEGWRYRSIGRLAEEWTVNQRGDVGIVETVSDPPSWALLILGGKTGEVLHRIEFPRSSSTMKGVKCIPGNDLAHTRASRAGSVFTSTDDNMYLQVEIHNETATHGTRQPCSVSSYSFENSLSLLRVTPEGEPEWRKFVDIHADGDGPFRVQPRVFAGETIPDGLGGVLAAWSYLSPGNDSGEKPSLQARLSRIGPTIHQDFTLPIAPWTADPTALFSENMVLGEDNILYATNRHQLMSFRIERGEIDWVRQAPTGEIHLQFATAGGGVIVTNAGRIVRFDAQGNGAMSPETTGPTRDDDIGFLQFDLFDHTPSPSLRLRDFQLHLPGVFLAVEDGNPYGRGALLDLSAN